jgi:hypothetical protein
MGATTIRIINIARIKFAGSPREKPLFSFKKAYRCTPP